MEDKLIVRDEALMPSTFDELMRQADMFVKSGLMPIEIKTPQAAATIMLMGRELSIPPMQAFRGIYVVKGKPTLSAQLMGALILRAGHSYHVDKSDGTRCIITFQRRGSKPYVHSFTMDDAKRADITGNPTWGKYPQAMLFSRCMSAGARICMPDVIAGMYTPEEIADPNMVTVDADTGEVQVIDVTPKVIDTTRTATQPMRVATEEPEFAPSILSEPTKAKSTSPEAPKSAPAPLSQPTAAPPVLPGAHWIDEESTRNRFWVHARSELRLSQKDVADILHAATMHAYTGTYDDAINALDAYAENSPKGTAP